MQRSRFTKSILLIGLITSSSFVLNSVTQTEAQGLSSAINAPKEYTTSWIGEVTMPGFVDKTPSASDGLDDSQPTEEVEEINTTTTIVTEIETTTISSSSSEAEESTTTESTTSEQTEDVVDHLSARLVFEIVDPQFIASDHPVMIYKLEDLTDEQEIILNEQGEGTLKFELNQTYLLQGSELLDYPNLYITTPAPEGLYYVSRIKETNIPGSYEFVIELDTRPTETTPVTEGVTESRPTPTIETVAETATTTLSHTEVTQSNAEHHTEHKEEDQTKVSESNVVKVDEEVQNNEDQKSNDKELNPSSKLDDVDKTVMADVNASDDDPSESNTSKPTETVNLSDSNNNESEASEPQANDNKVVATPNSTQDVAQQASSNTTSVNSATSDSKATVISESNTATSSLDDVSSSDDNQDKNNTTNNENESDVKDTNKEDTSKSNQKANTSSTVTTTQQQSVSVVTQTSVDSKQRLPKTGESDIKRITGFTAIALGVVSGVLFLRKQKESEH